MSESVSRRLRNRDDDQTPHPQTKSALTDNTNKPQKTCAEKLRFDSDSLSNASPTIPEVVRKKRGRKKKIRCTQDFLVAIAADNTENSDLDVKCKVKTCKKVVNYDFLPPITKVSEDLQHDELFKENEIPKKKRGRKKKLNTSNSTLSSVTENEDFVHKKRGRKKKIVAETEIEETEISSMNSESTNTEEENVKTKRGRKKKLNKKNKSLTPEKSIDLKNNSYNSENPENTLTNAKLSLNSDLGKNTSSDIEFRPRNSHNHSNTSETKKRTSTLFTEQKVHDSVRVSLHDTTSAEMEEEKATEYVNHVRNLLFSLDKASTAEENTGNDHKMEENPNRRRSRSLDCENLNDSASKKRLARKSVRFNASVGESPLKKLRKNTYNLEDEENFKPTDKEQNFEDNFEVLQKINRKKRRTWEIKPRVSQTTFTDLEPEKSQLTSETEKSAILLTGKGLESRKSMLEKSQAELESSHLPWKQESEAFEAQSSPIKSPKANEDKNNRKSHLSAKTRHSMKSESQLSWKDKREAFEQNNLAIKSPWENPCEIPQEKDKRASFQVRRSELQSPGKNKQATIKVRKSESHLSWKEKSLLAKGFRNSVSPWEKEDEVIEERNSAEENDKRATFQVRRSALQSPGKNKRATIEVRKSQSQLSWKDKSSLTKELRNSMSPWEKVDDVIKEPDSAEKDDKRATFQVRRSELQSPGKNKRTTIEIIRSEIQSPWINKSEAVGEKDKRATFQVKRSELQSPGKNKRTTIEVRKSEIQSAEENKSEALEKSSSDEDDKRATFQVRRSELQSPGKNKRTTIEVRKSEIQSAAENKIEPLEEESSSDEDDKRATFQVRRSESQTPGKNKRTTIELGNSEIQSPWKNNSEAFEEGNSSDEDKRTTFQVKRSELQSPGKNKRSTIEVRKSESRLSWKDKSSLAQEFRKSVSQSPWTKEGEIVEERDSSEEDDKRATFQVKKSQLQSPGKNKRTIEMRKSEIQSPWENKSDAFEEDNKRTSFQVRRSELQSPGKNNRLTTEVRKSTSQLSWKDKSSLVHEFRKSVSQSPWEKQNEACNAGNSSKEDDKRATLQVRRSQLQSTFEEENYRKNENEDSELQMSPTVNKRATFEMNKLDLQSSEENKQTSELSETESSTPEKNKRGTYELKKSNLSETVETSNISERESVQRKKSKIFNYSIQDDSFSLVSLDDTENDFSPPVLVNSTFSPVKTLRNCKNPDIIDLTSPESFRYVKSPPKLDRTSTFVKEDKPANDSLNVSNVTIRKRGKKKNSTISLESSADFTISSNATVPWASLVNETCDETTKKSPVKKNRFEEETNKVLKKKTPKKDTSFKVVEELNDVLSNNTPDKPSEVLETVKILATPKLKVTKFFSSPSSSSTPFPGKKTKTLLKKALMSKEKRNVTIDESKNVSNASLSKIKRTKVPNFKLIHQKALDKMENIQEMSQRKAERAKMLLSGCKPGNSSIKRVSPRPKKETVDFFTKKKQLNFNASRNLDKSKDFVPLPKTPVPSRLAVPKNQLQNATPKASKNVENLTPVQKKVNLLKVAKPVVAAKKDGFTRFGFKVDKGVTKADQIKAVATKSKVDNGNPVDKRRVVIKGVRSNRRFELLMKMRKKNE